MWNDTVGAIRLSVTGLRRDGAERPGAVRLHPLTWSEIVVGAPSWSDLMNRDDVGTLLGLTVVLDATLEPGTWRLEPAPPRH